MSSYVKCDGCGRTILDQSAGWTTVTTRRFDQEVAVDLCCGGCVRLFVDGEFPEKRPDFDSTRSQLSDIGQQVAAKRADRAAVYADERLTEHDEYAQAVEEAALAGEYDDVGPPVDDSGVPFDLGGLLARKKAQGPAARSHASRAAEATAKITASRVAH